VLPVYRRFESNDEFSDAFHGTTGALKVTRITDPDPVSLALVEAAVALGIERNADFKARNRTAPDYSRSPSTGVCDSAAPRRTWRRLAGGRT